MAYASRSGRARTSSKKPQAFAVCQRCNLWYNRVDLSFQYEWRGTSLRNLYILVCQRCLDIPQEQLRAIQLPADPTPIYYPSVEDFVADETNYRTVGQPTIDPVTGIPIPSQDYRVTEDCENRITQPIGRPPGYIQNAVMPYNGAIQKHLGVRLDPLSVTSNGRCVVTATFSTAHGLKTDDQISVEGLSVDNANGMFSVTVGSPMMFTYETYSDVRAAPLLTPTSRMITCLIGLPYGVKKIPQVGP